jgi:hypothetical protein
MVSFIDEEYYPLICSYLLYLLTVKLISVYLLVSAFGQYHFNCMLVIMHVSQAEVSSGCIHEENKFL